MFRIVVSVILRPTIDALVYSPSCLCFIIVIWVSASFALFDLDKLCWGLGNFVVIVSNFVAGNYIAGIWYVCMNFDCW